MGRKAKLMRTQSPDTSPEMERVQIDMLRKISIAERFTVVESWGQFIREIATQGIRQDYPSASEEEAALMLVARQYEQSLAEKVRAELVHRRSRK
jgi:hypothetical protein